MSIVERLERLLVLAAIAATLVVNARAGMGLLNGIATGEVAASLPTPFTPIGPTFAIWGLIYLGLAAFALAQLAGPLARSERVAAVRWPVIVSCLANVTWLLFWHHGRSGLSLAAMALLAAALAWVYRELRATRATRGRGARWLVDAVFSLYLGWVSVAALANLAVVLVHRTPAGAVLGAPAVASVLTLVTTALAALAGFRWRDPVWSGVLAWAAVGIALRADQVAPVLAGATLAAAVATAALATMAWRARRR